MSRSSRIWVAGLIVLALPEQERRISTNRQGVVLSESFDSGQLDARKWSVTSASDFRERTVDVVAQPHGSRTIDYRLRLRADTIGTDDRTVKYLGVVSTRPIHVAKKKELLFDLDWNRQANASYFSAAIYLCPTLNRATPEQEPDWLKFEYIGVPPGRNARGLLAKKERGQLRLLETEGWPDKQRTGRPIGLQRVRIVFDIDSLQLFENGNLLYEVRALNLHFSRAYLYLQMSSHSNYPAREVFFDNIVVKEAEPAASQRRR